MSKKNKDQKQQAAYEPDYVKTLREKGVVVLSGRSRGELDEMLASIPADCSYYCGAVSYHCSKGLYILQVNLK